MVNKQIIVIDDTEIDITQPNETVVEVAAGAPGPRGFGIYVQDTNPGLTVPGLWIQTGLGADGMGITFWIEDGK